MKPPSVKKNYLYSMIYQIIKMILPLITAPYLARIIGVNGVGVYSFTYAIAEYFVLFSLLGISNLGNRSIAKIRDNDQDRNKVFSQLYTLQLATSIICSIAYILYCLFFVKENNIIALLQFFYVLSSIFDVSWFFFGMENFKITVTRQIAVKTLTTLCIFIFVKKPSDVWKYTLILSLGTFIGYLYLALTLKKYVKYVHVSFNEIKQYIKPNLILFIPIIATSIYRVMDKVMLGTLGNVDLVGLYENSDKLVTTCLCIIGSFGSVMLPRMTNLVANGEIEKSMKYLTNSMEMVMFLACAICFGIASVSNEFIPIFYGNSFMECVNITKLLTISSLFISWANVIRMQYLIPNEKDKIYVFSIILGAIVNLLINFILIPKYGANGAAIGTICAEALVMLIQTIAVRKNIPLNLFVKKVIPFIMFGILMLIFVRYIANFGNGNILWLLLEICCGGLFYLLFSLFYFIHTKNEFILSILNKGKGFINDRNKK